MNPLLAQRLAHRQAVREHKQIMEDNNLKSYLWHLTPWRYLRGMGPTLLFTPRYILVDNEEGREEGERDSA